MPGELAPCHRFLDSFRIFQRLLRGYSLPPQELVAQVLEIPVSRSWMQTRGREFVSCRPLACGSASDSPKMIMSGLPVTFSERGTKMSDIRSSMIFGAPSRSQPLK